MTRNRNPQDVNAVRTYRILDKSLIKGELRSAQEALKTFMGATVDAKSYQESGTVVNVTEKAEAMLYSGYSQEPHDYTKTLVVHESGSVTIGITGKPATHPLTVFGKTVQGTVAVNDTYPESPSGTIIVSGSTTFTP